MGKRLPAATITVMQITGIFTTPLARANMPCDSLAMPPVPLAAFAVWNLGMYSS